MTGIEDNLVGLGDGVAWSEKVSETIFQSASA